MRLAESSNPAIGFIGVVTATSLLIIILYADMVGGWLRKVEED